MDHNLEDALNMETIENMDFDHAGVVNQEDITLEDTGQSSGIPMDLDNIEEQPNLLDTRSEEVIVSDFMGDQFGFQEYTIQGDNLSGANITIETNQIGEMYSPPEQVIDLQYADCVNKPTTTQSNCISIKAIPQQRVAKKTVTSASAFPRQVAIAPKPTKGAPNVQYAIAPKPVALVMNKSATMSKTVPVKNIVQGLKGNVLAQIGKQLVMMPAGAAGQKIKLTGILPSGSTDGSNIQILRCSTDSAQLVANKGKPLRTKFIVQGQPNSTDSNQPAVITKIVPVSSASQTRYVMQQKTVPISIGNKVVISNPTKQSIKVAPKKQIISIKAQSSPKVVTSQANVQTKKVVITANPSSQNVVVKTAALRGSASLVKDNTQAQRTQLHPINVPGKGIQYIKLVTNQPTGQKPPSSKPQTIAMSGKNFVLTDSKGNILQMSTDKVMNSQQQPVIVTSNTSNKLPTTKKLVRIAPISKKGDIPSAKVREATKMAYCVQSKPARAPQSLLVPRDSPSHLVPRDSPQTVVAGTSVSLEQYNEMVEQYNEVVEQKHLDDFSDETIEQMVETQVASADVKPTLASLISDAVAGEDNIHDAAMQEVEIGFENTPSKQECFQDDENSSSMEPESNRSRHDENLIIVPSSADTSAHQDQISYQEDSRTGMNDSRQMQTVVDIEADVMPYNMSPRMDYSDSMYIYDAKPEVPGMRPRKACNCTKSQCLKLYCDCFANGEFCNKCNCNNCHNNLENEELRQKAIRACLERNPNAFRPKIGKGKSGGPEIIRRHNKGCNCKRSGCLKNYCECYEAKIACTMMCKCVGCRNIEETLERRRDALRLRDKLTDPAYRAPVQLGQIKQPCSFMTPEVIEAVAQCMLATAAERARAAADGADVDLVDEVLMEFSRCMADIIDASHRPL